LQKKSLKLKLPQISPQKLKLSQSPSKTQTPSNSPQITPTLPKTPQNSLFQEATIFSTRATTEKQVSQTHEKTKGPKTGEFALGQRRWSPLTISGRLEELISGGEYKTGKWISEEPVLIGGK
jgi:hypothetical protein